MRFANLPIDPGFPGGPGRTANVTEFQSHMDDLENRVTL